MKGIFIVGVSIGLGTAIALVDRISGVILIVAGGLTGCIIAWMELS